jgi:ribonuclease J
VIVAGSQGQEGSSLMRAIYGEHKQLQIQKGDTVVFSADAIPGNEMYYYGAIDELCRNKVHVVYPALDHAIHRSGHASLPEQQHILNLIKPKFVMPIGGTDRHRYKFWELAAQPLGYHQEQVLLPVEGEVIGFAQGSPHSLEIMNLQPQIVDGLGVGDVGPIVLSDRLALGQSGIVVIVIPKKKDELQLDQIRVVSRGFIFMREATEVIEYMKEAVATILSKETRVLKDDEYERMVEKKLSRKLYQIIKREPLIVCEIVPIN